VSRSVRMFEIIQLLRSAGVPMTAQRIAEALEVTKRTVYRDIGSLQAMRVPIVGEAGVGYVMRPGFDLPPLNFAAEEVEAIVVGLAMLGRTGDAGLQAASASAGRKIGAVLPGGEGKDLADWPLYASRWNEVPAAAVDMRVLRAAIRDARKLRIAYLDGDARRTHRTVWPLGLLYYTEAVVLAAWCELREGFRHFRADRIEACETAAGRFVAEAAGLRAAWRAEHRLP